MVERLRQMADRYGYTVTALIRHCVEARLDLLDQQLARKAAAQNSMLKTNIAVPNAESEPERFMVHESLAPKPEESK